MSDHISGPRALAEPLADITDFYAYPSPVHPNRLVVIQNTYPFAQPTTRFSDGLIYRFRIRPVEFDTERSWRAVRNRQRRVCNRLHRLQLRMRQMARN